MQDRQNAATRCDHCAAGGNGITRPAGNGSATSVATASRIARRHLYKSAVFAPPSGRQPGLPREDGTGGVRPAGDERGRDRPAGDEPGGQAPADAVTGGDEPRGEASADAVTAGIVLDVSPHVLVISGAGGERHIPLSPGTTAWRGRLAEPTTVRAGDRVVVRLRPGSRVAEKMWAGIGRVTGTIVDRDTDSLLVDEGRTKRQQVVVIPSHAATRIQVRFPLLAAGNLIDVIGLRRGSVLEALVPATSQPAYQAGRVPRIAVLALPAKTATISGSATWREPAGLGHDADGGAPGGDGVAYPAIDPGEGCAEAATAAGPGCASLPYLALGSRLLVRNDCTGRSRLLFVTGCCAVAQLFCDRCTTCGNSPRVRIAELGPASFVRLGGDLERGCFNATISIGW